MERLKILREKKGVSQQIVADFLGITRQSYSNYENGNREPNAGMLIILAKYFEVTVDYLIGNSKTVHERNSFEVSYAERETIKKYRLLAPHWKAIVDSILDIEYRRRLEDLKHRTEDRGTETSSELSGDIVYFMVPEYSLPMSAGTGQLAENEWAEDLQLIKAPPRGTSYVAHVKGDSMEPTYHDGDLLFVHSTQEIRPGDIGVFLLDGDHYVKELGNKELISHNPAYAPIPFTENTQCQGLVLGVCDESYFE